MDNGSSLIENLIGIVIAGVGRANLEEFYLATGREAEASVLRATYDSVANISEQLSVAQARLGGGPASLDIADMRRTMVRIVQDTTVLRGLRWDMLQLLMLAPCTNVRELVFGPSVELQAVIERARKQLVRFPSEQELFRLLQSTPVRFRADQLPDKILPQGAYTVAKMTGALLRNDRLAGCVAILLMLPELF